jgi:RNA 2',3'-cyclic 3'-phosphodiesterase
MKRLFFALDICDEDKRSIIEWRTINLDNTLAIIHPITENNLHITLAFLGEVTMSQQLAFTQYCDEKFYSTSSEYFTRLANNSSFDLSMDLLQLFDKPKVLYLGFNVFPDTLISLADTLSKKAIEQGLFQEDRNYCPHVSIARKIKKLPTIQALNIPLNVTSFSLYNSQSSVQGVSYSKLNTWSLLLK